MSRRTAPTAAPDAERVEQRRAVRDALIASGTVVTPANLPIAEFRDELLATIAEHQVVVVAGETGSGKSTQLPKLCLELGRGVDGVIGHTQPRRVAARTIAERVADELGASVGGAVGYSVRFNDRVGNDTVIRVMTDGILLAELQRDRDLRRYDTIIVDEAHERSLNIDFILGYLKQLLPRRPDLKVIVTSATIDTERFAAHFADADGDPAPIVSVAGRTYPVEVRYRPLDDEHAAGGRDGQEGGGRSSRDQVQAIADAVDELAAEGPGDILVFLSGEREIHDTADALRRRTDAGDASRRAGELDVLPLYARLSSAEQHRIFEPGRSGLRRVVLSTNVAETSVTVPGIRYVVDAGTARISRYSRRLKVQRLPIEAISQASANQRAGRCGRVAPGICIRLYDAEDFESRPEFTDPEILRTNLASVILQMTSIGLGDVAGFPFIEPPDRAAIGDGYRLLEELGAITDERDGRRLTGIGRRLARLPVDPRLGRMVLESERLGCVREILVIAAALSIQDPRERPADEREQADAMHRRFDVEGSDLLSIVALWDHLREQQRQLSGNQFRRLCRSEYLNYLRVREWRDLFSQLRQVAGELGVRPGTATSHPDHVHQAVLSGLLSHLGVKDRESRDYRGARGSTFAIASGSVLSRGAARRKPPAWVMAAELVETNRLWARRVAAVQPEWAERLGAHLVRQSYSEPRWDARSGRAVATETVTLYGLPIVTGRTVGYDRVDQAAARDLFVRNALIEGEWDGARRGYPFLEHNRQFAADVAALEDRLRRRHLFDEHALHEFYDRHLPDHITSTRHFERWWKDARRPGLLELTVGDLVTVNGERIDLDDYPDTWTATTEGGRTLEVPLTYRYTPGEPLDGVTARIPLAAVNQVPTDGFDWLIAGYRNELVEALVRTLPKSIRRSLIPAAETVAKAAGLIDPAQGPLVESLAAALTDVSGTPVRSADFDPSALADHLRMHFLVVGADGKVHDAGDDLGAIAKRMAATARAEIAAAAGAAGSVSERRGIVEWDVGEIPRVVDTVHDGVPVRGYPALLDDDDSVSLRVFTNPDLQERVMRGGVRRLLLLTAPPATGDAARRLDQAARLAIAASGSSLGVLAAECRVAAVDAVLDRGELPWDTEAFESVRATLRRDGASLAGQALAGAARALVTAERVRSQLAAMTAAALATTVSDATDHLERLVSTGFVIRSGLARLADVERYVRGIEVRLERVAENVPRDLRRITEVRGLEERYRRLVDRVGRGAPPKELAAVGWQLEELRISVFAQTVGVRGSASAARVDRQLVALGG